MKNKSKLHLGAVLLAILIAGGLVYHLAGSQHASDSKKYEKVLTLYMSHKEKFPDVQEVSPREAMELANTGKVVFIDIRNANEQSVSRLPGAISIDRFLQDLAAYQNFIKIGYATIGLRSGIIAQELHQKEVPLYNLKGGLLAWVHAGGKVYSKEAETHRIHVYDRKWDLVPDGYDAIW